MPQFSSISELNAYINVVVQEILDKISSDVEERVFNLVKERLYDPPGRNMGGYTGAYYDTTYDFLTSVTRAEPKFSDGKIEVEIYYDSNKIMPQYRSEEEYWNVHMDTDEQVEDIWNGMSIPELLPLWMEYGTNKGLAPRNGIHVMQDVYNDLKKTYKSEFIKELKKYGIKVK